MNIEDKVKNIILELCEEDDYGCWELWWAAKAEGISQKDFIAITAILIANGEIEVQSPLPEGKFIKCAFDIKKFEQEINNPTPDHDNFYWFKVATKH